MNNIYKRSNEKLLEELGSVQAKIIEVIDRENETDIGLALDFDEYSYYMNKQIEITQELMKRGFGLHELKFIRIGQGGME